MNLNQKLTMKDVMKGAPLTAKLQSGQNPDFEEIGVSGLEAYAGFVRAAYNSELYWPHCFPLYDRIRRSDPEVALTRIIWDAIAREITFKWISDVEEPTPDDLAAAEFANEVFDDVEGGINKLRDSIIAHVPYMGWGLWEIIASKRLTDWKPPGSRTPWRSQFDDGRIGIRKFAFRDHSSFSRWDQDDETGEFYGMIQNDVRGVEKNIPFEDALHLTFGDSDNPEGLATLEPVWRLERIKYGLEIIQGIGFEHASGHASFHIDNEISDSDKAWVRRAARALMTAQEGNYILLPKDIEVDLLDVPFSAAASLLEAIRYYGLIKLQIFNMQWVSIASTAGTGAFAAAQDASTMFLTTYNAMMEGFTKQISTQVGRWLFKWNDFPGMIKLPVLTSTPIEKLIPLDKLGTFMTAFAAMFDVGIDDVVSLRKKSGFLSEQLPEEDEIVGREEEEVEEPEEEIEEEEEVEDGEEEEATEEEAEEALSRFQKWAKKSAPKVYSLLGRRIVK